jgi:hypothetical protein
MAVLGGERPVDLIWPKADRRWTHIGPRDYQFSTLYGFDTLTINLDATRCENLWEFRCGSCGSGLLHVEPSSTSGPTISLNTGQRIAHVMNLAVSRDSHVISHFWCVDGLIGFLHSDGQISILTTAAELLRTIKPPEFIRVIFHYPFSGGIAFFSDTKCFWVFDSSTGDYSQLAPGKILYHACAIAYVSGKGFMACAEETGWDTGEIMLAGLDSESFTILDSRMPFQPVGLRLSPRGGLVAAYDRNHLFIRSPQSALRFPVISLSDEDRITSLAFPDEQTAMYVSKGKLHILAHGSQDAISYHLPHEVHLIVQDGESIRVFTRENAMLLTPVHPAITALFQKPIIDRLDPLIRAKHEFENGNIESYKILEGIKFSLSSVILAIMEAAPHILDVNIAERLLAHAAFAKYQLPDFNHDEFGHVIRDVQVLTTLRSPDFGWMTTGTQLTETIQRDPVHLVSIAIQMQKLELAGILADLYGVNPSIIGEHWAARMLKEYKGTAIDGILRKISQYGTIDYIRLAKAAVAYAIPFSDVTRLVKQVRDPKLRMTYILDELHNDPDALQDVVASQDGNAIMSYIFVKKMRASGKEAYQLFTQNPGLADQYAAFRKYSRETVDGCSPLKTAAIEIVHISEGFGEKTLRLEDVRRKLASTDGKSPWLTAIDSIMQTTGILKAALQKEAKSSQVVEGPPIPTKSPRLLMSQALIDNRSTSSAVFDQLAKQFQVSKEAQEYLKLHTYAKHFRWDLLGEMAKKSTKLPPDVFAEVCAAAGRRNEAVAFINRISDSEKKLAAFQAFEYWEEAAKMATILKRPDLADALARRARNSSVDD